MTEPSQYFKGRTVQEQMNEVIGYVDTRAAEVATTAIASDVAQVHQDKLDADADAQAAAASAAAAAGTLANAVKKTGEASQSIAGDIAVAGNLSGGVVTGTQVTVPTPVNNTDAASKKYVDDQNALDVHLAGNQTVADVKTFSSSPVVPTVATGTADTKAANGTKVKNELDNYAPMVRTTGNQNISGGTKYFTASNAALRIVFKSDVAIRNGETNDTRIPRLGFTDMNDALLGFIGCQVNADKTTSIFLRVINSDGSEKTIVLGKGDVI